MPARTYGHFIGGHWISGKDTFPNINPSDTRDVIGHYARGTEADVQAAVAAATAAFSRWAATTPQERFDILDRVGSEILARAEELGTLLAREEGKTVREAIGEVRRAGHVFKFFAGEALRVGGEYLRSVRPGVEIDLMREPVGVVGLITPWNFPIAIPAWKVAPALAYGNTVVLKPAEQAPASAWMLAEILSRVGLPPGAFNLVLGDGSVGATLVAQSGVSAISFTGSREVGRQVAEVCARRMIRVQVEMGGKNPLVVLDDAPLEAAVEAAVNGAFFSAGERCTASSRLIVTERIYERFREALLMRIGQLRVGSALDPATDVGPVIDEVQLQRILHYIELGKREGAMLVCGGQRLTRETPGFYLAPTLFDETDNRMTINQEEIFGPVAALIRVRDYEEALAVANDTEYGLSAGIFTRSLKYAHHFRQHVQAGTVMVNLPTAGLDYHIPFGGHKASGYGPKEQGQYAREFYTLLKTCYVAPHLDEP